MTKVQHILLSTLGSLGDLNPYLVLGRELRALGFKVSLATHASYRAKVEEQSLSFIEQFPNWTEIEDNPRVMKKLYDPKSGAEFMLRELLMPEIERNFKELARSGPYDLIFTNTLTFATNVYADKFNTPCISVVLSPLSFFSPYDPPILPVFSLVNKLTRNVLISKILFQLIDRVSYKWSEPIQRLREKNGLERAKKNPLTYGYFSDVGTVVMLPDFFLKPQEDWPKNNLAFLGFPFLSANAPLKSELVDFIEKANAKVIVYTLGSVLEIFDDTFFELAIAHHELTKTPAIFVLGPNYKNIKLKMAELDSILLVEFAPYDQLFPKASLIIHHGGIGTIAEAMRAGTPQLIVPFTNDQPENARRCADLGVARVLDKNKLNEEILSDEIKKISNDIVKMNCMKYKLKIEGHSFSCSLKKFMSTL
ncbi:MAG: glycosyltransferase [Bacteriovorax sp.]|jgi:UDP:flavonoid glycosyltransferase YjiC (YdhE family)